MERLISERCGAFYNSVLFFETVSHVEVTVPPGDGNAKRDDHGIKNDKNVNTATFPKTNDANIRLNSFKVFL